MVNCEQVRDHLSAYHDGMLDADTAEVVRAHVATCAQCSEILADYARFDAVLSAAPRVSPDASLRDRIFTSPAFREIMQGQREGAAPTAPPAAPPVPQIPPRARLGAQVARVWLPVILLLVLVSGSTLVVSRILAGRASGPAYATCAALSGGQRLVYGADGTLFSNDGRLVCAGQAQVSQWAVSPDGHWVAYVDARSATLRLVRADATGDHQIDIGAGTVQSLVWSLDSSHLIFAQSGAQNAGVTFWSVATNETTPQRLAVSVSASLAGVPAISPDGQTMAAVVTTGPDAETIFTFATHIAAAGVANDAILPVKGAVLALGWTTDSDAVLTWITTGANGDATFSGLHRSALRTPSAAVQRPLGSIAAATFSASSTQWAVATKDGAVQSVDARSGAVTPLAQLGPVTALTWSPDGTQILALNQQTLWLVSNGGATKVSDGASTVPPAWNGTSFAFVASGTVEIAQVTGGHATLQPADSTGVGTVAGLAWSPNGGALAIWGSAGIALVSPNGQQTSLDHHAPDGTPQWTA